MRINVFFNSITILVVFLLFTNCNAKKPVDLMYEEPEASLPLAFDTSTLKVKGHHLNLVRGQVLYVPVYSNLPSMDVSKKKNPTHDLSAVLAIHNTDLTHSIRITKVSYFNTEGRPVKNFLAQDLVLKPLAATNFYIAKEDTSGAGANFIVEWISKVPVCEPLVESIMLDLKSFQGTSFLSKGKVIREER